MKIFKKAITVMLMSINLNINALEVEKKPIKIFGLDLTDEKVSTQGGDIVVLKLKNYCILVFNLYGEMGQEKYAFRFNKKGLITTRHVGFRYPLNVYDMKPNTKFIVDFDKTYKANESKSLIRTFYTYHKRIPNKILDQCY